jgi:hypothetical protein
VFSDQSPSASPLVGPHLSASLKAKRSPPRALSCCLHETLFFGGGCCVERLARDVCRAPPSGPRPCLRVPLWGTQSSALGQEHSLSQVILNRNIRGLSGENTWVCELRVYNNHNRREDTSTSQPRQMTHERSDVPDERLCDASERFARFASTSMQVPVHGPCIMRTRCVSVDCRQRYPSEISTWYWFCPPAARGASCSPSSASRCISAHLARRARHLGASRRILLAELVRLPPSNVACPGRPSWQRHCQAPSPFIRVRLLQPQLSTESAAT